RETNCDNSRLEPAGFAHNFAVHDLKEIAVRQPVILGFAAASLLAAAGAERQFRPRGEPLAIEARGGREVSDGRRQARQLDFRPPRSNARAAPLALFVHGGGWTNGSKDNATGRHKAPHYTGLGYNFASIDYRLVPDATVEQQAQDVADALKELLDRAGQ